MTEPKKPTKNQREILSLAARAPLKRTSRERQTSRGSTFTFSWTTPDGAELSERVIDACQQNGWLETRHPTDEKLRNVRDMVRIQNGLLLEITDAGQEALASKARKKS